MKKSSLLIPAILLVAGVFTWLGVRWYNERQVILPPITDQDRLRVGALAHPNAPTEPQVAVATPILPSQKVRLAIGGLGLPDDSRNRLLADLLTVELSRTKGLELVERPSFDKVLRELEMNLSGLVRAKDAVQVGKLVRADWFLLGSSCSIHGTNVIIGRIVDARTGILRDIGLFESSADPLPLGHALGEFTRQSRQATGTSKPRVFLAVGGFADVGVNARQAAFPAQLRASLMGAYQQPKQPANLTLLEREAVDALLQEVRLDLAGLTEGNGIEEPAPIQSAFWVVDGFFQSYETSGQQVEVVLRVTQAFWKRASKTLRGQPGEALFLQAKSFIDETLAKGEPNSAAPTRRREIGQQLAIGEDLMKASWGIDPALALIFGRNQLDPLDQARRRNNMEEAMRAFQTVLLLDHNNRKAKLYLGACLLDWTIGRPEEARNYFREVADSTPPDAWSKKALETLGMINFSEFGTAAPEENANDWLKEGPSSQKALEKAEKQLLGTVRKEGRLAFDYFMSGFATNQSLGADHLVRLWPKLKEQCPDLAPTLVADLVSYLVTTNSPVVDEFRQTLAASVNKPETITNRSAFFGTAVILDYEWSLEKKWPALAAEIMEAKRQAAGREPKIPLTDTDRIRLAFAYVNLERWRDALEVFEELGETPVNMDFNGPWGSPFRPFLPAAAAAECRAKLGLPPVQIAGRFDFGKPCLCLHTPSVFAATEDALWVAIGGKLLQLGFNLATNLEVALPVDSGVAFTAICVSPEQVWMGTESAGLIEYNTATRKCRVIAEADGLLRNDIGCLCRQGDVLWIGCGSSGRRGGLAKLDLRSGRVSAFTPSLPEEPISSTSPITFERADPSDGPPAHAIHGLGGGLAGEVWMFVSKQGLRRYVSASNTWGPIQSDLGGEIVSFTTDREHLIAGLQFEQLAVTLQNRHKEADGTIVGVLTNIVITRAEFKRMVERRDELAPRISNTTGGTIPDQGGLASYDLRDGYWKMLLDSEHLPAPPTKIFVVGGDVWVGGLGYVAVVDAAKKSVRKLCYIPSRTVDGLQVAGGFLWAQYDNHLHKAPLSATR
jgi:tetratricopeptide (TPR) repeat protein